MYRKRASSLVGILIVSLALLAGCGGSAPSASKAPAPVSAPAPAKPAEPAKAAAPAPAQAAKTAAPSEPIKLGGIIDTTGVTAFYGPKFRDGLTLRFEEAGWQVAGRKIELISEDGATKQDVSLEKAKKMIERDKVAIMFGPLNSAIMAGMAPYYSEKKVPVISFLQHGVEMKNYPGIYTPNGSLSGDTFPLGDYAAKKLGLKSVTTIGTDMVAGRRFVGGFVRGFEKAGGKVVQDQWPPYGGKEFGPYITSLKDADALVAWIPVEQVGLMKQYWQFGKKAPILVPYADSLSDQEMAALGDATLGVKAASAYVWRINTPENQKFVAAFEKKFNRKPDVNEECAYEAASFALAALEVTKGDTTPDKLHQALMGLKLKTPAGEVSFAASRFGVRPIYIAEVKKVDGKLTWEPVETYQNVDPLIAGEFK